MYDDMDEWDGLDDTDGYELLDNEDEYDDWEEDEYDDSLDGDHESGLASAGWGTDEDYGYYGENDDSYGEDY